MGSAPDGTPTAIALVKDVIVPRLYSTTAD